MNCTCAPRWRAVRTPTSSGTPSACTSKPANRGPLRAPLRCVLSGSANRTFCLREQHKRLPRDPSHCIPGEVRTRIGRRLQIWSFWLDVRKRASYRRTDAVTTTATKGRPEGRVSTVVARRGDRAALAEDRRYPRVAASTDRVVGTVAIVATDRHSGYNSPSAGSRCLEVRSSVHQIRSMNMPWRID
jgi:hypothetical protein